MFDSIKKIFSRKEDVVKVFEALKLSALTSADWDLIKEYLEVMEPIAFAIDYFQGDKDCFLGIVAPTINVLILKLNNLYSLKIMNELRDGLVLRIRERFSYVINLNMNDNVSKSFTMSAITHPKFKLSWVPVNYVDSCKTLLIEEYKSELKEINNLNASLQENETHHAHSNELDADFFSILQNNNNMNTPFNVEMKVISFLEHSSNKLEILHSDPIMKTLFIKYNTTIPSSAPVERLFSTAIQIFTPRRNRLADETFGKLIFLKGNSYLNDK